LDQQPDSAPEQPRTWRSSTVDELEAAIARDEHKILCYQNRIEQLRRELENRELQGAQNHGATNVIAMAMSPDGALSALVGDLLGANVVVRMDNLSIHFDTREFREFCQAGLNGTKEMSP
jgi:hypothetical protein